MANSPAKMIPAGTVLFTSRALSRRRTWRLYNLAKLSAFPIPLPPPAEQMRLAVEVESRLALVEEVETHVNAELTRSERLRQSLLVWAFAGRIVSLSNHNWTCACMLEGVCFTNLARSSERHADSCRYQYHHSP